MANRDLNAAKKAKKDEFYTQLSDIQEELRHYKERFRGKTVLCNCDDPRISNFFHYFEKDGDFRSPECVELLKQADIVVTNPPFSLFREYVAQLVKYDKKFLIIGHQNAIHYKEIFSLIMDGKIWLGYGFKGNATHFFSKYEDIATSGDHREGMVRVSGVCWFTNLDIKKRHEELILYRNYTPEDYPRYENFDAIDVGKVSDIPEDWNGMMGVPDTFLDKYNPDQFEIVGLGCGDLAKQIGVSKNYSGAHRCRVQGQWREQMPIFPHHHSPEEKMNKRICSRLTAFASHVFVSRVSGEQIRLLTFTAHLV